MIELFELSGTAAALIAAYQGHLLQALLSDRATFAAYAEGFNLNPRATKLILDILVNLGIADCNEGMYTASAAFTNLDNTTPGGMAALAALWSRVPDFLLHGERFASMDGSPASREAAYSGIAYQVGQLFADAARELAANLNCQPTHILDVGAGSGIWSLALAERCTETRVTALDFPHVLHVFQRRAQEMGLSHRVDTLADDFHSVTIPPARFDCILIANVLHLEQPHQAASLIQRVKTGLLPGGKLVIVDMIGDGSPEGERSRAIYALHLALRTEQASPHSLSDLHHWLEEAGLVLETVIWPGMLRGLGALVASNSETLSGGDSWLAGQPLQ